MNEIRISPVSCFLQDTIACAHSLLFPFVLLNAFPKHVKRVRLLNLLVLLPYDVEVIFIKRKNTIHPAYSGTLKQDFEPWSTSSNPIDE